MELISGQYQILVDNQKPKDTNNRIFIFKQRMLKHLCLFYCVTKKLTAEAVRKDVVIEKNKTNFNVLQNIYISTLYTVKGRNHIQGFFTNSDLSFLFNPIKAKF